MKYNNLLKQKYQVFLNAFDTKVDKKITFQELFNDIKENKQLYDLTDKYRYVLKTYPGKGSKGFKAKNFNQVSLIKYNDSRSDNNFNLAYGFVIDIDKKDNPRVDILKTFDKLRDTKLFNFGFISLSGGIKLIRLFDKNIRHFKTYKAVVNLYLKAFENRFNMKIDYAAYKHSFINHSSEVFYYPEIDNLKTDYYLDRVSIEVKKENITYYKPFNKKNPIVYNKSPDEIPNLLESIEYLSNIRYSYKEYISIAYAIYNSFGSGGSNLWSILNNNPNYQTDKDKKESLITWNRVCNTGNGNNDYRTIIKIAINNGYTPKQYEVNNE